MARLKQEDIHTTQSNIGPIAVSIPAVLNKRLFSHVIDSGWHRKVWWRENSQRHL